MGPKSKRDKRLEALERMERKGPAPKNASTDVEYGSYLHRRIDEMDNIKRKIGAEKAY